MTCQKEFLHNLTMKEAVISYIAGYVARMGEKGFCVWIVAQNLAQSIIKQIQDFLHSRTVGDSLNSPRGDGDAI